VKVKSIDFCFSVIYNERLLHRTNAGDIIMEKFTSIEQFRNVIKMVRDHFTRINSPHLIPTHMFTGTVKLHGTNAGVRRLNNKFQPQSRERILDITSDNYGFANFIASLDVSLLNTLFDQIGTQEDDITIYGEWIGKGIQDTVAVSQLPGKQWVIFAAKKNGEYYSDVDTLDVKNLHEFSIHNIWEIPAFTVEVNFKTPETAVAFFEKYTLEVEEHCPWGLKFGIDGMGEGIVWTCAGRPTDESLWFKTKGQKHSKSKVKTVAPVDVEKINGIRACVELILPEGRLKQGLDLRLAMFLTFGFKP
jgi:hypothetical protein